ncbi:MAG: cytochrome c-type biogenesis protein CcmH [Magnetococcales bacterium]|nr:cytochrome c-type biogenesis protein CcmH [Magnetococcales bacterium]
MKAGEYLGKTAMRRLAMSLLFVAMFLGGGGTALHATERQESAEEARVRALAVQLRCAVCQNQSIYESNSELAKDMLLVIRDKIGQGESDDHIRKYFYDRYGDYIYLEPVKQGGNWILWAGPLLGLMAGVGTLWLTLRRWRRSSAGLAQPDTLLQQRIRSEMERLR